MRISHAFLSSLALSGTFLQAAPALANPSTDALRSQARAILKKGCAECHDAGKSDADVFGSILDLNGLKTQRIFTPGAPASSTLIRRIKAGDMPPAPRKGLSAREIATLESWITAEGAARPSKARSDQDVMNDIGADLVSIPVEDRPFIRYFTLHNLTNEGADRNTIALHQNGVSKLLNSLSWADEVVKPKRVGNKDNLLRIDLRDYDWNPAVWEQLIQKSYEFSASVPKDAGVEGALGTTLPYVRGDWFIATASRPPLYDKLIGLGNNVSILEANLDVDVEANIREGKVVRSGFNGSGVSKNNRMIERHSTPYGAYWKSYDFAGNSGPQNLFERPLGPSGNNAFVPAGGEVIFNLPNGLQGYMLAEATGAKIDKAPNQIVQDPKRPDGQVENGISCLRCHGEVGIINKADQIRNVADAKAALFSTEDLSAIHALYPKTEVFTKLVKEDGERYRAALKKTAMAEAKGDPITDPTLKYEDLLSERSAAAEAGVDLETFLESLSSFQSNFKEFGITPVSCEPIPRVVYNVSYDRIVATQERHRSLSQNERAVAELRDRLDKTRKRAAAWVEKGKFLCAAPCVSYVGNADLNVLPTLVVLDDDKNALQNLGNMCAGVTFADGNPNVAPVFGTLGESFRYEERTDRRDFNRVQLAVAPAGAAEYCVPGTLDPGSSSKPTAEAIAAGWKAETKEILGVLRKRSEAPLLCAASCGSLVRKVGKNGPGLLTHLDAFPIFAETNSFPAGLATLNNRCYGGRQVFTELKYAPDGERSLGRALFGQAVCSAP